MTLATLDQLFGEVPPEHEHLERYGYREETIQGQRYYVGRSAQGMAITMRRHRGGGLMSIGRRKKKTVLPEQERTLQIKVDDEALARAAHSMGKTVQALKTVDFSKLTTYAPRPQEKPNMLRRVALWCTDKFYDEEWQKGMTNTAGNTLLWSFTAFAVLVFAKGAWWVLSM